MRKSKIKKINLFIFLIFIILIIIIKIPKNYQIKYSLNDIIIEEKYNKNNKLYTISFIKDNISYPISFKGKYKHKRIINEVNFDDTCIIPSSKYFKINPVCYKDNMLVSHYLVDDSKYKNVIDVNISYNKININYLNDKRYLIFNYKGFYSIKDKNKDIKLFNEDVYNLNLVYKIKDNLVIANYDNKYNIDKFYVINKKDKVKTFKVKYDISFDSYFLGAYKNNLYLFDKKNKKEYVINISKLKIVDITKNGQGKILEDGKFVSVGVNKIANNNYSFSDSKSFNYVIEDERLYKIIDEYKILVTDKNVKDIVSIDNDTVYYLVNDSLYCYNDNLGEILLMSYFEWNFNYKNMIFIF